MALLLLLLGAMILTNLLRTRFEKKNRVIALFLVVAIEVLLGAYVWQRSKPGAILGFLVKNGNQFTIAWKDEFQGYDSNTYPTIEAAMSFAREELKLSAGVNPITDHELESLWVQDRFGSYMVMWKTVGFNFLNQISFQRRDDAQFFASAFRQGSYSPSPFGHSVLLMPARRN